MYILEGLQQLSPLRHIRRRARWGHLLFDKEALPGTCRRLNSNHVVWTNCACGFKVRGLIPGLQWRSPARIELLNHPTWLVEVLVHDALRTTSEFLANLRNFAWGRIHRSRRAGGSLFTGWSKTGSSGPPPSTGVSVPPEPDPDRRPTCPGGALGMYAPATTPKPIPSSACKAAFCKAAFLSIGRFGWSMLCWTTDCV